MAKVSQSTLDMVRQVAEDIAEQTNLTAQGVIVSKVEYIREAGIWYLRITLAKESGITVNDCETLHRPLSKRLDELDPIPSAYFLEVCSGEYNSQIVDDAIGTSKSNSLAEEK